MLMALEKFHATVMIFGADMHNSLQEVVDAARKYKTRLVIIADTGQDFRATISPTASAA